MKNTITHQQTNTKTLIVHARKKRKSEDTSVMAAKTVVPMIKNISAKAQYTNKKYLVI